MLGMRRWGGRCGSGWRGSVGWSRLSGDTREGKSGGSVVIRNEASGNTIAIRVVAEAIHDVTSGILPSRRRGLSEVEIQEYHCSSKASRPENPVVIVN
jgi:hypothetical protein